jgi:hypothetical protein
MKLNTFPSLLFVCMFLLLLVREIDAYKTVLNWPSIIQ